MPVADKKSRLRAIMGQARAGLDRATAQALSERIAGGLLSWEVYLRARAVVLYAAIGREVATDALRREAVRSHRAIFYPRVIADRGELVLVRVEAGTPMRRGALGVFEPESGEGVEISDLSDALVIVPGVAFSRAGDRLGRGGGYYDRLLARAAASVVSVGLSYGFQLLDAIPRASHDQRLDVIATEFAIHRAVVEAPTTTLSTAKQGGTPGWTC
jgi:5-formyltetrahydrofolate cyclo-ligase